MSIRIHRKNLLALAIASAATMGFMGAAARAATVYTWANTGTAWTTAAEWTPAGGPPTITDTALFSTVTQQPTVGASTAVGGIQDTATGALTITLSRGDSLSLGSGGLTVSAGAGAVNISTAAGANAIILTAPQTWSNASANALTVGVVTAGANTLTIDTTSTGTINFSGGVSGTGGIILENGTLTAGAVVIGGPITFGTSTTNATLDLQGNSFTVGGLLVGSGATAASQLITNTGTTGKVLTVDTTLGSNSFGGTIDNGGGSLTANTLGLNKIGANTLTLTGGANITYTGTTSGTRGTLEFAPDGGSGTENLGAVAFTSGGIIIQSTVGTGGTAALNFTGTAAPVHTVGATGDFVLAGAGTNSINIGTTVTTAANTIIGPWLTFGTGASTQYAIEALGVIGGFTPGAAQQVTTANSLQTGGTVAFSNYDLTIAGSGNTDTLTGNATADTFRYFGGANTIATAGNTLLLNGVMNDGTGTLTIDGTGTNGVTIGSTNELVLNAANADIELSGTFNFNGAANQTVTITGPNNVMFNQINNTVAHTLTFDNGSANVGALVVGSSQVLSLNTATATSIITINNPISDNASGASSVVIGGAGTVNLANTIISSSFSGGLTLNSGTLGVSGALGGTLGTGTVTINGGTISGTFTNTSAPNFQFNGNFATSGTLTLGSTLAGAFDSPVTLGTSITINVTANTLTLGSITDGGNGYGITKAGPGTLTLLGTDTSFTGPLTITGGAVTLANGSAQGVQYNVNRSTVVNVSAGAAFDFNSVPDTIAGLEGAGTLETLTSGRFLTFAGTGNYVFTGGGNGQSLIEIFKVGSGTQTFGGTFNGGSAVTVGSGTLELDFNNVSAPATDILFHGLPTTSATTVAGGTLLLAGSALSSPNSSANSQQLPQMTVASGASAVKLLDAGNSLVLTFGNMGRQAGGTVDFTLPSGTQNATNGVRSTVANTNSIIGGWATVDGTDWAVSSAPAVTTASWNNTNLSPVSITTTIAPGAGTAVSFNTTVPGTGLTAGQIYYVLGSGTTFNVALSPGGTAVNATATNMGTTATLNIQGNITAYTDYTPFVGASSTTTANYLIDPTQGAGTGTDVVTASETFNSLKINPSAADQSLTLGTAATAVTLTLPNPGGLLFTGNQDYTIASGGNTGTLLKANTEMIVQQFSTGNLTISATINSGSLDKAGPGTLTLTAANQFSGNINLNQGILNINSFAALGTNVAGNTLTFNGGTLQYAAGFTGNSDITTRAPGAVAPVTFSYGGATIDTNGLDVTFANTFGNNITPFASNVGGLTKAGSGTLTIDNIGGYNGPTTVSGGTLSIGGGPVIGAATFTASTPTNNSAVLTLAAGSTTAGLVPGQSVTGPGIAPGTIIVSIVSATVVDTNLVPAGGLTGSYTFGALTNYGIANGGATSSIGNSTYAADNLVLDGGTLQYTGAATSTDRLFSVTANNGGSAIEADGSGPLVFTSPGNLAFFGTTTLTLTGSNTDANTLHPVISDSVGGANALVMGGLTSVAGVTSVTKSGSGTWVLTGNNTYSGVTTITGGTLKLAPIAGNNNIAGSSKIIVGDSLADNSAVLDVSGMAGGLLLASGQTLAGHGTVVGNVTTSSGSVLAPGNTIGTTSYSANLTLATGTVLDYEFAGSSSSDDSLVAGLLTLPTGTGSITLNMTDAGGLTAGTFKIFGYGTLAGGAPSSLNDTFVIDPPGSPSLAGDTYSVVNNAGSSEIDLVITGTPVPEPASLALLGLGAAGLLLRRRRRA